MFIIILVSVMEGSCLALVTPSTSRPLPSDKVNALAIRIGRVGADVSLQRV